MIFLSSMRKVISLAYVNKYVSKAAREQVRRIINDVKKEYSDVLTELNWLDDKAKEISKEKLANCTDSIAHSDARINEGINKIYSRVKFGTNVLKSN